MLRHALGLAYTLCASARSSSLPRRRVGLVLVMLLSMFIAPAARAQSADPTEQLAFDQHLGDRIPHDIRFVNERGQRVEIGAFFDRRPVVILMVYFNCPTICGMMIDGAAAALFGAGFEPGDEYELLVVSIDSSDRPATAAMRSAALWERHGQSGEPRGWHFLTGQTPQIDRLADAIGFRYTYDEKTGEFPHPAGFVIATPDGEISKYFYGVSYPARDVRFALIEASQRKIGTVIDRLLLFCYSFDPETGQYTVAIVNILRLLGSATATALAVFVFMMIRRERKKADRGWRMADGDDAIHHPRSAVRHSHGGSG